MHTKAKVKGFLGNDASTFFFAFIVLMAALFFSPPAWAAEDKKDKKSTNIGDMTVTSTKMTTEVDRIPTNIAVIPREEIEKYPGHYNALSLLRDLNVPGLYFSGSASGFPDGDITMSARGGELSNWAMKVMINGVEYNSAGGYVYATRLAVHDIERIEVTKTPSAVYGDQAIGGVINIITRQAKKPLEAKAGIAYNSLGGGHGYGVINGSQEKWEYYLDASAQRAESYQDGGSYDIDNAYTKVGYALNDNATLSFHGLYRHSVRTSPGSLTREQFEQDPTQNPNTGADTHVDAKGGVGAVVYEQKLGPHELMCKVEMQSRDDGAFQSRGFYLENKGWEAHPEVNMTFNHDIAGMANKLVIGGEYRFYDFEVQRYKATSFSDRGAKNQDFSRTDISYAGYLQDELRVTNAFTVTAGIRYDHFDLEQTAHIKSSDAWDQKKGAFSPKIGFTYQLCNEVNLFAGFNSGIKSPVRLPMWFTNGELDPEKLKAYEVGVRGNISGWLDYNMAIFWQNVNDKFVRESADSDALYENAGETSAKGVELGVHARLPHGFYASTSFTYQQSEFEEFVSQGVDYSGNHLPGVPDMMFAFQLGYRHKILGDISLNPVYTGKRYFNYANTNEDDGFWILNATYRKTLGRFEFYIAARNLFDEKAIGSGSGNPGKESFYPVPGFNATIGLNVAF